MTQTLKANTLDELLPQLNDEWYENGGGEDYTPIPKWGPKTEAVEAAIGNACADGDIVSWDTRSADEKQHRFLVRNWDPAKVSGREQVFSIVTAEEL